MLLAGCTLNLVDGPVPETSKSDIKVPITLDVRIPTDGISTKAMADDPQVRNMVVVVFGGSGYFNEWVPVRAATELATENYNSESNFKIYRLKFELSLSESRLRLHFIANCPSQLYSNPPITGISSQDLEDVVMSKVRSQITDSDNDGYWAKILLPYGVQVQMDTVPNTHEIRPKLINGEYVPTNATKAQIERYNRVGGIPMVRNFARIYLDNKTPIDQRWTIQKFCLAYAPAEGPIAPILPAPITTNEWGDRVVVQYANPEDETGTVYPIRRDTLTSAPFTVRELTNETGGDLLLPALESSSIYSESFFINYQNYPMTTEEGQYYRKLSDAPFNYGGYSPANLAIGTYPSDDSGMKDWSATTPLYIYERAKPASGQKPTRIIVKAYKNSAGEGSALYYPLDLVDENGDHMAFLRNFTYIIDLTGIAEGSGYETIAEAADATGANVSMDPRTEDLNEVSNGASLIAVSYIDATYIKQGTYDVMFHYEQPLDVDDNDEVTFKVGYGTGFDFVPDTYAGNGSAFSSTPTIEKSDGHVVLYVRTGDSYTAATAAQIADPDIRKWGKITYTTATVDRNGDPAVNSEGYYTKGFSQTIRVYGAGNTIFRDVLINLTPLKTMEVVCLDKYIDEGKNINETVRVYIPGDLTRSMFPLVFKVECEDYTLNPAPGTNLENNMPVNSGATIIPDETGTKFYFIRTVTRDEYNSLPTAADGTKYFNCPFITTEVVSATTVYVANEYFTTDWDEFYNFSQRKFTSNPQNGPGELQVGQVVPFTFYMDAAHNGGTLKWNDADELDYTSDRIIPHTVLITLNGISPQIESASGGSVVYVDPYLEKVSGNVYKVTIQPVLNNNDLPAWTEYTLHLVAGSAASYSITLSTSGNTPNPGIYADYTVSGNIDLNVINNIHFENAAGNTINRALALAGQEVYFCYTYDGPVAPVTFTLNGLEPASGQGGWTKTGDTYTFTPASGTTQRFKLVTTGTGTAEVNDIDVDSSEYAEPNPNNLQLERYLYSFGTTGFYTALNGNTVQQRVTNNAGANVYYRFTYDSEDTARQDVTITATGLTSPSSTTGTLTANGDHTWTYHPTSTAQNHWITWTTEAVTSGSNSSVTVSSSMYDNSPTATITRRARVWRTQSYEMTYTSNSDGNATTFTDVNSGIRVEFSYFERGGSNNNRYKMMGSRSGRGTLLNPYVYNNGQYVVSIPNSTLEGIKITGITMTYSSGDYDNRTVTVVGDVSTTAQSSAGMTSWSSASTGEGNGDNQVTVTMSCSNSTEYSGRNRLTGVTVYYGYWED